MEADLTKDLYRVGTKDGILNSWYARNQFRTCTEGIVNIADVPSVNISLRACVGKASLFGGQGYRRCNFGTSNFGKRQILVKQVYHIIVVKPIITAHQKQTVDFSFMFYINVPFSSPSGSIFFFIVNAPYSCNFPGPST